MKGIVYGNQARRSTADTETATAGTEAATAPVGKGNRQKKYSYEVN
jgi:hypothetical protein